MSGHVGSDKKMRRALGTQPDLTLPIGLGHHRVFAAFFAWHGAEAVAQDLESEGIDRDIEEVLPAADPDGPGRMDAVEGVGVQDDTRQQEARQRGRGRPLLLEIVHFSLPSRLMARGP